MGKVTENAFDETQFSYGLIRIYTDSPRQIQTAIPTICFILFGKFHELFNVATVK